MDFAKERVFVGLDWVEAQPKERRLKSRACRVRGEDAFLSDPLDGIIDEVLHFVLVSQIVN